MEPTSLVYRPEARSLQKRLWNGLIPLTHTLSEGERMLQSDAEITAVCIWSCTGANTDEPCKAERSMQS